MEVMRVSLLGRLFREITLVSFNDSVLILSKNQNVLHQYKWSEIHEYPDIKDSIFGSSIRFKHIVPLSHIRFLNKTDLEKCEDKLTKYVTCAIRQNIEACEALFEKHATKEYLRDSNIEKLQQSLEPIAVGYQHQKSRWQANLSSGEIRFLDYITQ
jgi:hypothetical protein